MHRAPRVVESTCGALRFVFKVQALPYRVFRHCPLASTYVVMLGAMLVTYVVAAGVGYACLAFAATVIFASALGVSVALITFALVFRATCIH